MTKLVEELIAYIEDVAGRFAFLVPTFLHFLVVKPWTWLKENIDNIITGVETIVLKFLQVAKENQPEAYAFVEKCGVEAVEKTRLSAKALERKREQGVELLYNSFQLWKRSVSDAGCNIEKNVIHPTVTKAADKTKTYILKAIEISEPAVTLTKPVWSPIVDKVIEVKTSAEHSSFGPTITKVEAVVGDAVDHVLQYCNVQLSQ